MEPATPPSPDDAPLWQRLGWVALIWIASVSVLGLVAYILRWWING